MNVPLGRAIFAGSPGQAVLPDALGARPRRPVGVVALPGSEAAFGRPALVVVAQRVAHLAVQEAVE